MAEGAARFFFAETVGPRPTRFDIGISSAVDWSSNWEKGSEREVFTSVSGQRFVLGKWTAVVKQVSFRSFAFRAEGVPTN